MSARGADVLASTRNDLIPVASLLVVFLVVDRLTLRLSSLSPEGWSRPFLAGAAAVDQPLALTLLAVGLVGAAGLGRDRFLAPWSELEHGTVARVTATGAALWLAWGTAAYPFNYLLDTWHALDRLLVCALAAGVAWRPAFLLPFLAQQRILNAQFAYPFGADYAQAADELVVLVLVVIAAAHLMYAALRRWHAAPIVLLVGTIVASHFFEPGLGKLQLDWLRLDRVAELPLNAEVAGWTALGGGGWARSLSHGIGLVDTPLRALTLVMEVGAVVAVAHHRLLRLWLPVFVAFHVATFAMTGFMFADWMALELGLLVLLTRSRYRPLIERNATPLRALVAVAAVAVGGWLYHPPRLAWLDAPVAYGYELEGVDPSGGRHRIDAGALAPFTKDLTFATLTLTPREPLSGGYGAIGSPDRLAALRSVTDFDALDALEAGATPTDPRLRSESERLILAFFDRANQRADALPWLPAPPARFWTAGPLARLGRVGPFAELQVVQVTSLSVDGGRRVRRTPVLTIAPDADGRGVVTERLGEASR